MPSSSWREPRVGRLLLRGDSGVRAPERDVPADYARAIAEAASLLTGRLLLLRGPVTSTARALTSAIEACDVEIASLGHVANLSELDRLTAQLAALENARGHGRERAQMRELLQQQVTLVRRMRDRAEAIALHRTRLFALLGGLWARVAVLRGGE